MRNPALKKIGKRVLQIGLPIVIIAFFLYKIRDWGNWQQLIASVHQWNYWLLALSFLGFILQEMSYGLIWQAVLRRVGDHLPPPRWPRPFPAPAFFSLIPWKCLRGLSPIPLGGEESREWKR